VNRDGGFGFIFASCHIDYRSPGHFDEEVAIRVRPAEVGTKSLKLEFEMRVGERLLADGYGVLVGFDYGSGQTVELPEALRLRL
jgi:acyl-CoA thioester hydrolase